MDALKQVYGLNAPINANRHDPNNWLVGASTAVFPEFGDDVLTECKAAGIACIELVLKGNDLSDSTEPLAVAAKRVRAIAAHDLQLWSVHLPFGKAWDIASPDADVRQQTIRMFNLALQRAAEWGAAVAVIHGGAEPIVATERAERLANSCDALAQLAQTAHQAGIRLALECLPRTCLGNNSAEMLTMLKSHEQLRANLDVNHTLQEPAHHMAVMLAGKIATVHISDYDGIDERHWMPGRGVVEWTAVIAALAAGGYTGPFMFETSHVRNPDGITPDMLMNCWRSLLEQYNRIG